MLTEKQMKLLHRLDGLVQSCTKCDLHKNGRAKPYWSPQSQYGLFLEAPGKEEVVQNTPVVGAAGNKLWNVIKDVGLSRDAFLIVNSVNCRPVVGGKNGKPTIEETTLCGDWVRKYIRIVKPAKMLIMGKYAIESFNRIIGKNILPTESIVENNGLSTFVDFFNLPITVIISVHPAYTIYNPIGGTEALKHSINIFRIIK